MPELTFAEIGSARKGRLFDEFALGQLFVHHWGRTVLASDSMLFTSLTLNYNPLYVNSESARELGHSTSPVNPYLTFLTVLGLSVEDLSEGTTEGAFLGVDDLEFFEPVYPGDTLTGVSEVVALRPSRSRPGGGIVTWRSKGFNQSGATVLAFTRTNLVGGTPSS
ncbi:MaoC family dehydratase [Nocardia rhizosphaerihabitans]|uniref:MaoC family dehydratase n=1 Tax=Nocardia rhizosphaerihabitans TaxID=1691570 RepID=A0ABQ2KCN5_9NOCA|nr:MaoC family dehydratase [Nocardia rhizosphaerihabitans]GGN78689.1 MaoC family dehydratase [Nocardia rhizosphaerihabitans]